MTSSSRTITKDSISVSENDWLYRAVVPSEYGESSMVFDYETEKWFFDISSFYNFYGWENIADDSDEPLDPNNDAISCGSKNIYSGKGFGPWEIYRDRKIVPHHLQQGIIEFPVLNIPIYGIAKFYCQADNDFSSKRSTFRYGHVGIVNRKYEFPSKDEFLRIVEGINKEFYFVQDAEHQSSN